MTSRPHFIQTGAAPALTGSGFGMFVCPCGGSLLIAGYEPRLFLGIAIQCAACGAVSETPSLPPGVPPPVHATVIDPGATAPSATPDMVLVGREEATRIAARLMPRQTEADVHILDPMMLDDLDFQQRRWTGLALDPDADTVQTQPLAWAVAHLRRRLADPDWPGITDDTDMVAMTQAASVRDLFGGWVHHPLFGAMIRGAAADGFSLHAQARFAAAKALMLAGNRVEFIPEDGPMPAIAAIRLVRPGAPPVQVVVHRFDRFEWPFTTAATPRALERAIAEAMDSHAARINRLHPGLLILSAGATDDGFDQMTLAAMAAAIAAHGRRHRGLAALGLIMPKIAGAGDARRVRFGHRFHPFGNRHHDQGRSVRAGARSDYAGLAPGRIASD